MVYSGSRDEAVKLAFNMVVPLCAWLNQTVSIQKYVPPSFTCQDLSSGPQGAKVFLCGWKWHHHHLRDSRVCRECGSQHWWYHQQPWEKPKIPKSGSTEGLKRCFYCCFKLINRIWGFPISSCKRAGRGRVLLPVSTSRTKYMEVKSR